MRAVLLLLGAMGVAALLWLFLAAVYRLVRAAAERFVAGGTADTRARRGDVTGMEEAQQWSSRARRREWVAVMRALGWGVLLVVPSLTAWAAPTYASCAVLWLLIVRRHGS